jgi:hypothetical protein
VTDTETPRVFGRPVEDAAAALAAATDRDADTVADDLSLFVVDGTVSRDRVDDALAGLSKVVSTPETRLELAAREVERAHDVAAGVADLDTVTHRLDGLDDRLAAVESEVATLGNRLTGLLDQAGDPAAATDVARGVEALTDDANIVQAAADDLRGDAEATKRWAEDPETRSQEFGEDVDAVAASVDRTADAAGWLTGEADDLPEWRSTDDPGVVWAEARTSAHVADLLVADLRAELADLRTWAAREGTDPGLADDAARVEDLAARRDHIADRLDDAARPAWREAHADRVGHAIEALATFDPPVAWGAVRAALDEL